MSVGFGAAVFFFLMVTYMCILKLLAGVQTLNTGPVLA